jgi:predicted ATPase/class 3 adenylate cyclase
MSHHPLTFLFTDLENSSRLWEQFPDEMRNALARHDMLLKKTIETHGGCIVKTTGDGLHAIFESPSDAVTAALDSQQAIIKETWSENVGTLKVRMGLHTGESQERDGDYYGPAVNRAARVMGIGHGGQILISEVTSMLIRDSLPQDASLLDLGQYRLKGLTAPEQIFQLYHPALQLDFPPLTSLETYKHNLPVQLTSFIGRESELSEVKRLLSQTRLLTLLGPGGTGKTRLALQTAADLVDQYPDGVWLIELAPLTDPDLIPDRVAATFNTQEQHGRPILETLINYLRRKELLLLLDNVEHLVRESAEFAEQLLMNCPSIKILVTGREALFIGGETTLQIPSLSLPQKESRTPEMVADSEAVQLFIDRARAVRPDFDITPDNALALAEVVRRLDGIPLALELAAARLRMMSVEQIAARLNNRFRLLTGGRRTALPRQQTLQALIDWSWNLLDEQEQVLLRRLSVFSGGWTLEAAQAVTSDDHLDEFDILDLLDQLINKSLVNVEHLPKGNVRYAMLESIRQYARDRLFEAGEGETLRDRHAEYFSEFGEHMAEVLEGPDMLDWLDLFLRDMDNAKTAREWAVESRLDLALRMAGGSMLIRRYWFFNKDGFNWVKEVVKKARAQPALKTDPTYPYALAGAVTTLGAVTMGQGETAKAIPILEEGVVLAEDAGAIKQKVFGLNMLLICLMQLGEFQKVDKVATEALALSRSHGFDFLRMMALGSFTPVFAFRGNHEDAHAYTQEAIELAKRFRNPWAEAMSLQLEGHAERGKQNWRAAEAAFSKAYTLFKAVRDTSFMYISLSEAGHMKRILGDYAGAEQIYRKTILFFRDGIGKSAVIHQLESFGMVAAYQGQNMRAATLLGAAQALRLSYQSVRLPPEQIEFDEALAQLAMTMGKSERDSVMEEGAKMTIDEAVTLALEIVK